MYVRVPPCGNTSVSVSGNTRSQKPIKTPYFGRVEKSVISDSRISAKALRVFAAMTGFERDGVVNVGLRELGKASAVHWSKLGKFIRELVRAGYVKRDEAERGQRFQYHLTTPLFTGKLLHKFRAVCSGCSKEFKKLPVAGICKSCSVETERVQEYRAAAVALGPEATHSEIVKVLQADEHDRRWLKVAKRAKFTDELAAKGVKIPA